MNENLISRYNSKTHRENRIENSNTKILRNESEKRRQKNLNYGFMQLSHSMKSHYGGVKLSKAKILQLSLHHLKYLDYQIAWFQNDNCLMNEMIKIYDNENKWKYINDFDMGDLKLHEDF